jgi:hypothetical protein
LRLARLSIPRRSLLVNVFLGVNVRPDFFAQTPQGQHTLSRRLIQRLTISQSISAYFHQTRQLVQPFGWHKPGRIDQISGLVIILGWMRASFTHSARQLVCLIVHHFLSISHQKVNLL